VTITTTIRVAAAGLVAAGVLSPVALAGGEPKNESPFTRSVADRTLAQVQRSDAQARVGVGEAKNEWPFTRPVAGRTLAQVQGSDAQAQVGVGEAKNEWPFTRPIAGQADGSVLAGFSRVGGGEAKNEQPFTQPVLAPPVVVRSSDGFDWSDAGIGVAAGFGLAGILAGGLLLTYHGPRTRKIGAAATR
jgi:hypothetical protein